MRDATRHGFTLIELSIVLVIIGLIVGGVLVGRDLIKASQIRSTLGEYESFNTAANTFRLKYNCLPGDCAGPTSQFGFAPMAGSCISNGDGNKIIGYSNGYVFNPQDGTVAPYENGVFWWHLKQANLISHVVNDTGCGGSTISNVKSKLGANNWWVGYMPGTTAGWPSWEGLSSNAFFLVGPHPPCGYFSCGGTLFSEGLFVEEASAIDSKADDGVPNRGSIRPVSTGNYFNTAPLGVAAHPGDPGRCLTDDGAVYANAQVNNRQRCALALKVAF